MRRPTMHNAWTIARLAMTGVLVGLGVYALIRGETMMISPWLWAAACFGGAALILCAREE